MNDKERKSEKNSDTNFPKKQKRDLKGKYHEIILPKYKR
jgi:hypothetical protein